MIYITINKHNGSSQTEIEMLSAIWDDIDQEAEAIVMADTKYDPGCLSNSLYEVIDNRTKRRQVIKKNKIKGLFANIDEIRKHRDELVNNEDISLLIKGIFKIDEINSIEPLDRVFLNAYYRRLLRAKLERDFIGKELVLGQVITDYTSHQIDLAVVETLRLLRLVCKYLGVQSTTHEATFPIEKLYMPTLWRDVSNKFLKLFGENRVTLIEVDDDLPQSSMEAVFMFEGQKRIRQTQVLMLLNITFNAWSGSTLIMDGDMVKIVPAQYVVRMLPKLR